MSNCNSLSSSQNHLNQQVKSTPLHNCLQITLENEYFKNKLTHFYKENKELKQKLSELNSLILLEKNKKILNKISTSTQTNFKFEDEKQNIKSLTSLANQSTDTSPKNRTKIPMPVSNRKLSKSPSILITSSNGSQSSCCVCTSKIEISTSKKNIQFDSDTFNQMNKKSYVKLCEMQHNLLKKYQDEVNSNTVKQDFINNMKVELADLELKCSNYENEIKELNKHLNECKQYESKYKKCLIDLETAKFKCQTYKKELKQLFDEKFFEEIDDLKKSYNEAVKLNKHYEALLFNLNTQNKKMDHVNKKKLTKHRVKFNLTETETEDDDSSESIESIFQRIDSSYFEIKDEEESDIEFNN